MGTERPECCPPQLLRDRGCGENSYPLFGMQQAKRRSAALTKARGRSQQCRIPEPFISTYTIPMKYHSELEGEMARKASIPAALLDS
jgi:hypothetical protein